jgi:hypothetical protein
MGGTPSAAYSEVEVTAAAAADATNDAVNSSDLLNASLLMVDYTNNNTNSWDNGSGGAWWWGPAQMPVFSEGPTPAPTLCHERLAAIDTSSGLFASVEGMHVVSDHEYQDCNDDDAAAVWVYQLNQLHVWAEVVAGSFMVLTLLLMVNQIGLHLTYNDHQGFRTYTVRILLMVCKGVQFY